jgi:hypothetical protein
MTDKRPRKLGLKKRKVRRLDASTLEQAQGGGATTECAPSMGCGTASAQNTIKFGTGTNHNQALRRASRGVA